MNEAYKYDEYPCRISKKSVGKYRRNACRSLFCGQ